MTSNPFLLKAGQLQRLIAEPVVFEAEKLFDGIQVIETRIDAESPVSVSCRLEALHDGVMVSADFAARWVAPCRRCDKQVSAEISWGVSEYFVAEPEESEAYLLNDEELDLLPMVNDQLRLQLPLAPVCDLECKGLCIKCGTDLNLSSCECETETADPRWDALSQLKFDE